MGEFSQDFGSWLKENWFIPVLALPFIAVLVARIAVAIVHDEPVHGSHQHQPTPIAAPAEPSQPADEPKSSVGPSWAAEAQRVKDRIVNTGHLQGYLVKAVATERAIRTRKIDQGDGDIAHQIVQQHHLGSSPSAETKEIVAEIRGLPDEAVRYLHFDLSG